MRQIDVFGAFLFMFSEHPFMFSELRAYKRPYFTSKDSHTT